MSEQATKKELREQLKQMRAQKAEAKQAVRAFKKEHGTDVVKKVKDKALAAELEGLLAKVDEFEAAAVALKTQMESATSNREKYVYGKIKDQESGEERDPNKTEKKRWRAHARGVAAKEGINPEQVPFDPEFFAPKPKKEKKEKEAKPEKAAQKAPAAEAKTRKRRRSKED